MQEGKFGGMVYSNMGAGADPTTLAREFGAVRRVRTDCTKPVWHCALSCPPGERLSDTRWNVVVRDFMIGMGFDDRHQVWAGRHDDAPHDHAHIVANRVGIDGSIWHGKNEGQLVVQVLKQIEIAHGLKLTFDQDETVPAQEPALKQSKSEKEMWSRRGVNATPKETLSKAIEIALRGEPSLDQFRARLLEHRIESILNFNRVTGELRGMSFKVPGGLVYSGSQIAKRYGWAQLRQRLTIGDPIADAVRRADVFEGERSAVRPAQFTVQARIIFEIYGEALAFDPRFVRRREDGAVEFRLAGGQRMLDADTAVSLSGAPDADAIAAMLVCVEQHHRWDEVQIDEGSPEFRAEFARQAMAKGIRVVGYECPDLPVISFAAAEAKSVHEP